MNKDQVEGRVDQALGKVKEVAGQVFNSPETELEGTIKKKAGETQAEYGDAKEDVKDAIE